MKLDLVCQTNDENYTPSYAIKPLLKYIDMSKFKTIWCPFDTKNSWFVKIFEDCGYTVIATHLEYGNDFFSFKEIPTCDIIISNPPYSLKTQVLQKLFENGKPFAMLVGVVGLFESQKRFDMFRGNDFELMYFNKRVAFFQSFEDESPKLNPPFSSVFVCHGVLPKQIVFETIDKQDYEQNTKKGKRSA